MQLLGTQQAMLLQNHPVDCSSKHCQRQLSGSVSGQTTLSPAMLTSPVTTDSKTAGAHHLLCWMQHMEVDAVLTLVAEAQDIQHSTARALTLPPAHLGKQVVQHMDANAVVNLAEDAIVPVHSGQPTPEVAPLLQAIRKHAVGKPCSLPVAGG